MGNDPWPNTVAAKVIASYIHLKFDLSAADLMFFNPPMGAMPFFNNSASKEIRHAELALVSGKMLRFLTDLRIPLEADKTAGRRHFPILLGRTTSGYIYIAFLIAAYLVVIFGVLLGFLPRFTLLALITIVFAVQIIRNVLSNSENIPALIPAMGQNVIVNLLTPVLLAIGLFIG